MVIKNKLGQIGYFTSVILVFIGFAFFGIFIMQNASLTGQVITSVDLPGSCSDAEIQGVWDSIFQESSSGISIIKNDSLFGGKCAEYFANKSDINEINYTYVLYGYTKDVGGKNISYVFAEKINATENYMSYLNNITDIENVSASPVKNDSFFETYVNLRTEEINSSNKEEIFNETFEMNLSETWASEVYLNNLSYSFFNTFSNDTYEEISYGRISFNYSYAIFSFTSNAIVLGCAEDTTCEENWSICINQVQNKTCTNSSNCYTTFNYSKTRQCGFICVQNWSVGNWSDCLGGLQIRVVNDLNSCGNNTGKPAMNQSCSGISCISNWSCGSWSPSDCPQSGTQKRTCTDKNNCNPNSLTKSETQSCIYKSDTNWVFILIILGVIGAILAVILFLLNLAKKKEDEKFGDNATSTITMPPSQPPMTPAVLAQVQKVPFVRRVISPVRKIIPSRPVQRPTTSVMPLISVAPKPVAPIVTHTMPKLDIPELDVKPVVQKPVVAPMQSPVKQIPIAPVMPVQKPVVAPMQPVQKISRSVIKKIPLVPVKKTFESGV